MPKLDENTLLAYVDGQLDAARRREVEAALTDDRDAQELVSHLRRTPDLKDAFDALLAQPLAPQLSARILRHETRPPVSRRRHLSWAFAAVLLLALGLGIGYGLGRSAPRLDPWLLAVAHYQALYARETLNVPEPTPASVRATERQLGAQLGRALHIPDWRARGLAFKRGQVLEFAHEPLIQLTYLPRHGKPLAYCIRRSAAADAAPAIGEAASLRLIHWQRAGYAHVVIGEADDDTLRALAATAEAR